MHQISKYNNYVNYIYELFGYGITLGENEAFTRSVTFQVTDDCPCACTYCYQGHKGHRMMSRETAKKGVDLLFKMYDEDTSSFINKNTKAIILDFIGGEPLMNIDVIDYICSYFMEECLRRHHPWLLTWRASMISNGALYFDPKVQAFLKKFNKFVSFGITIDGPKEIHDSCRIYHDGHGNFDDAYRAFKHYNSHYGRNSSTKVTIAPENLDNLNKIIKFFIDDGVNIIHANTVFEAEWTNDDAKKFYCELKKMADYLLDNNVDAYVSLFSEIHFDPMSPEENGNWCWGKGTPILTDKGYKPIEEIQIGDLVYTHTGELKPVINTMHHFDENVCTIKVSGAYELTCTKNHRLFTRPFDYIDSDGIKHYKDDCIKEVKDIGKNDLLFLYNDASEIKYIKNAATECTTYGLTMKDAAPQEVYNITVADNHSYIAGGLLSSNCGGTGGMLSFDPDGIAYPCIRYMPSSLGDDAPPITVGTVDGIFETEKDKETKRCLDCITRRSQSTDECWNCPIASGCAWCSGWNYQLYGTPDKRCTRICPMHKARSLANVYYWNKYYRQNNIDKHFKMYLPKEEALKFITEDEYNMLLELSTK